MASITGRHRRVDMADGPRALHVVIAFIIAVGMIVSGLVTGTVAQADVNDPGNLVQGVSPNGTTINVFDYWLTSQDASDQSNPDQYGSTGINQYSALHFGASMGTSSYDAELNTTTVNHWTGNGSNNGNNKPAARSGIVSDTLDENGYPQLASVLGDTSLSYLFDPDDTRASDFRATYADVDGLLQVDEDGYYYYNSQQNFAELDSDTNAFTLYNTWGVEAAGQSPDGQFFPFNTGEQVFEETSGGITQNGTKSTGSAINHYFGLTMSTRFVQQYGGHVSDDEDADVVTYNFSGDDDVWVYIDGVLVGDLGGIHDKLSLQIDFASGQVVVYSDGNNDNEYNANGAVDGNTASASEVNQALNNRKDVTWTITTLKALFEDAGEDTSNFSGDTFADDTYHTLDLFYLERGNADSNLSLKYNLVTIPETDIQKVDQDGNGLSDVTFDVYATSDDYIVSDNSDLICTATTDSNGNVILMTEDEYGNEYPITLDSLYEDGVRYLVFEEQSVPDGYRSVGEVTAYLEEKQSATDASVVVLQTTDDNLYASGAYVLPKVTTTVTDSVKMGDRTLTADDLYSGIMFAVVEQQDDEDEWHAVSGDPLSGWSVSGDTTMESKADAASSTGAIFELASSGAYQVTVDGLPGDLDDYQWFGGSTFRVAYYYTTATNLSLADDDNTQLIINSNDFDRQFSARVYIPNISNSVIVQKFDDDGSTLTGATFALYNESDVTVNEADGSYKLAENADPVKTATTANLSTEEGDSVTLNGAAVFSGLTNGTYYIVETAAPDGYDINTTPIMVIVTDDGVYANAGSSNDGVTVERGIGRVVSTMTQFAASGSTDAALHDVIATPQTATVADGSISWNTVQDEAALHLSYDDNADDGSYVASDSGDGATSEDGDDATDEDDDDVASEENGAVSYEVDEGIPGLSVQQCNSTTAGDGAHGTDLTKTNLESKDLTALYTGSTIIEVTDEETPTTGSLRIDKDVENGTTDSTSDDKFTYTLNLSGVEDGAEFAITKYNANDEQVGEAGTISSGDTFTLKDGQYVVIADLPGGANYTVTETDSTNYIESVEGDDSIENNVTAEGTIVVGQTKQVTYTNTYVQPVTLSAGAALTVVKNLMGKDLSGDGGDANHFTFTVTPRATGGDGGSTADEAAAKICASGSEDGGGESEEGADSTEGSDESTDCSVTFGTSAQIMEDGVATNTMTPLSNLTFTLADAGKTFTYEVSENVPSDDEKPTGYTYDETRTHTVAYTVTLNDNNALQVTVAVDGTNVESGNPTVTFNNSYQPESVTTGSLSGSKSVTNEHGEYTMTGGEFSFTISSADESAPLPSQTTVTNDADGNFSFGSITFTAPGSYTYTVRETVPTDPGNSVGGITYDSTTHIVVYTVEDKNGQLTITSVTVDGKSVTIGTDSVTVSGLDFTNTYNDGKVAYRISGVKSLETNGFNGASLSGDDYGFALYSVDGEGNETHVQTVKNDGNGGFAFDSIEYAEAGTYTYKVYEVGADGTAGTGGTDGDNVTYSTEVYTVKVTVVRDTEAVSDAALKVSAVVTNSSDESCDTITFTNTYTPTAATVAQIGGTKTLAGRDLTEGEFTFQLVDGDGEVVSEATNAADGSFTFGDDLTCDTTGTYTYMVREVVPDGAVDGVLNGVTYDTTEYQVVITVTEDTDAKALVADVTYQMNGDSVDGITFENTYTPTPVTVGPGGDVAISATKTLDGADLTDGQFTFQLTDGDGTTVAEATNTADGIVTFGDITYDAPGEYTYTLAEVNDGQDGVAYDETAYTVTVSVVDNLDGTMSATMDYGDAEAATFTNVYTADAVVEESGTDGGALSKTGVAVLGTLGAIAILLAAAVALMVVKRRSAARK